MIGQVFGRLTVIEEVGRDKNSNILVKCRCSCEKHKELIVKLYRLKSGETKSCRCINSEKLKMQNISSRKNYIGVRNGRLVVIGEIFENNVNYLQCLCDCGNKCRIRRNTIRRNQSCGCLLREIVKINAELGINRGNTKSTKIERSVAGKRSA